MMRKGAGAWLACTNGARACGPITPSEIRLCRRFERSGVEVVQRGTKIDLIKFAPVESRYILKINGLSAVEMSVFIPVSICFTDESVVALRPRMHEWTNVLVYNLSFNSSHAN